VGEANHADRCGKKKEQPPRGPRAVNTPSQPSHGEGCQKRGQCAWEASGGLADAEKLEAEGCGPVIEDRLFEPRLAIEARSNPVAGLGHVPCNPGVARLVGTDEADDAEIVEVAEIERGEDEDGPE